MKPIIYQVFPRYWGGYESQNVRNGSLAQNGCGHFGDFDNRSLDYIKGLGCTHIWFTGVIRHATGCNTNGCNPSHPDFLKGNAGSPYAITDYYDVNPYLADDPPRRMVEFEQMVQRTHAKGMKVIIDFVPNHVSRDNVNFGQKDDKSVHWKAENDFYYYPGENINLPNRAYPTSEHPYPYSEYPARATGNNCFNASPTIHDWYETVKLNYCDFHTGTWDKMLDILRFWASKGVDGFRCDMVELVPSEFFEWVIARMKEEFPGILFIAEVYKKELYRYYLRNVRFDYLYDKSGMYDEVRDIMQYNVDNKGLAPESWQSVRRLTKGWQKVDRLQPNLLYFLENHDEQRIASDFFLGDAHKAMAGMALTALFNTGALMIYSGQEVGEKGMENEGFSSLDGRNTIFDWWKSESMVKLWDYIHGGKLDSESAVILNEYRNILHHAASKPFNSGKNYDLCYCNEYSEGYDPDKHFSFLRYDEQECYVVVCNFSDKPASMKLNIPNKGIVLPLEVEAFSYTIKKIN